MAAAQAMLDEVHETPPRSADDTNSYVLGSIKAHNIVITCLPEGQYGTVNAATVATNLKRTFPGISMAMMVGIGGGVPSKGDIRLGDVVVGTRIMQYDLGKIVTDGKFQRTAVPRIQQPLLGTALNSLRAKHELYPSLVPSILQQKLGSYPNYSRPSAPDRLFQATYEHELESRSCDSCDQSKLIKRSDRPPNTIKIHHGAIASGNHVIRNAASRDNIAQELDVICFEMEAAGPMDVIPCLPVRGICDYADSHKNKEWQRYAAATAVAYARELIEELPMTRNQKEHVGVVDVSYQIGPESRRQQLVESLQFPQMESRKFTIKRNLTKTCQWLLHHPAYKAWLDPSKLSQHHGFMWISGKPGAGKSTLMKFAYQNMNKTCRGNVKLASHFFNARGEYLEKSTSGMYRSLLFQLFREYRDLHNILDDPDIIPQNQGTCPPLNILKYLFRNAIAALGQRQLTCFIDALDECDEEQVMDMVEFFEELGELAIQHAIPFRICFSSRHYPYIVLRRGIRLTLEDQSGHAADLETFITSRLRISSPSLLEEVKPKLLKKAAGVFMWVVLVVQMLNEEDRRGGLALRRRLEEIPSDLSKLFKDILTRDTERMDSFLLCIRWILFSKRPLQPEEFHHALWSGLSPKGMADSQLPDNTYPTDRDYYNKMVVSSSKGLAEITKSKTPIVQFIHESVQDFLVKDNGVRELWPELETDWESSSHEELKICCHFYFTHPSVLSFMEDLPSSSKSNKQEAIADKYPFLKYASQKILYHANTAARAIYQDRFLSIFPLTSWIGINNIFEKHEIREYSPGASLLYILAIHGYSDLVRTRLRQDSNLHVYGERYCYPLFAALANGEKDTVAALLGLRSTFQNGVDIKEGFKNHKHRTPLTWAAQEGRLDFLKLLIQAYPALDEKDFGGRTALIIASKKGDEEIARLFIENGANVNAEGSNGETALMAAAEIGSRAIANLLIENKANVNAKDAHGNTALLYASEKGNEAIASLLIKTGADVDADSWNGKTALMAAAERDNKAIEDLLIKNKAW